jgi:hypothetical protein
MNKQKKNEFLTITETLSGPHESKDQNKNKKNNKTTQTTRGPLKKLSNLPFKTK